MTFVFRVTCKFIGRKEVYAIDNLFDLLFVTIKL